MVAIVQSDIDTSRRWAALAVVVAAQFMFGVDAFIVNVAIPTIATELHASSSQVEAIVAIYLIGYATLVVTGGRLGDIFGAKSIFMQGVAGFSLASLWCGLARSAPELLIARLAQGATAALMVPQVLATIHVLFPDAARARAFSIYGIVLGLSGAAGFLAGGILVSLNLFGLGWRSVFFVNIPFGVAIIAAASKLLPSPPKRVGVKLDVPGSLVLFAGLLCLLGPLLFGRDLGWRPVVWVAMSVGVVILFGFLRLEQRIGARGGMPLVDSSLMADLRFRRGLCAAFCFYIANLSFYLVMTLYMQNVLGFAPLVAGAAIVPLALIFVAGSRLAARWGRRFGAGVLIAGCAVQVLGLVVLAATTGFVAHPSPLAMMLALLGYGLGQGLVMAPLSGVVLATVQARAAGSAAGLYGATIQVGNATGVAAIGSAFFAMEAISEAWAGLCVALALAAVALLASMLMLQWMRWTAPT